uniref:Ig-like domain-containing protein n=1 Tax=Stegastes partitus TaxID=144197 RepID=A0A3B4ZEL5_9TELE
MVYNAVIDLTMISTAAVTNVNHFTITCISGERSPAQVELDIKRDNKILVFPKKPNFKVHKPRNKEAVARDFRDLDNIGIFYCESTQEVPPLEMITMINNFGRANFIPNYLTLTANRGETVHLNMELISSQKRDVTWKYNGNYYYMTHWNDMINRTAVLTVEDAKYANQGIYSASYVGDSPLQGAWMRLIVRGLLNPYIYRITSKKNTHTHSITCSVSSIIFYGTDVLGFACVFG